MKLPLIILFSFVMLIPSISQNGIEKKEKQTTPIEGKEAIKLLSEGTLIVRLSRLMENIESIKVLEGMEVAQLEKERIDLANIKLIKEFKKDYSFSNVVFAYEKELHEYLQGSEVPIFLNNQLRIDPNIKIKEGPIFILLSYHNKVFQLHDIDLRLVGKPSPEYSTLLFARKYKHFYAQLAQSISQVFTKKVSAAKFNKKLFYNLNHRKN